MIDPLLCHCHTGQNVLVVLYKYTCVYIEKDILQEILGDKTKWNHSYQQHIFSHLQRQMDVTHLIKMEDTTLEGFEVKTKIPKFEPMNKALAECGQHKKISEDPPQ